MGGKEYALAMLSGYEKWKQSEQGKEFAEKEKNYIPVEIKDLPEGWTLMEGSVKDGYFNYSHDETGDEMSIESYFSMPIWAGGYPKFHFVSITLRAYDDEGLEGTPVARFSIHELGWDEAWKQANERLLGEMESPRYG